MELFAELLWGFALLAWLVFTVLLAGNILTWLWDKVITFMEWVHSWHQ